ncbi:MAG: efflux RND transporter periplasmic adaptor subunit [Clostridiales bacterium]|nr:efflux RND transporter periplasmic adaptor subunit [Clostridiales bacterium]
MKKQVKIAAAAVVALGCLLASLYWVLRPVEVQAVTLEPGPLVESFTEQGSARPLTVLQVGAPCTGQVGTIHFKEGRRVLAGEHLMDIDQADLQKAMGEQLESLQLQQRQLELGREGQSSELTVALEQLRSRLAQLEKAYADLFGAGGSAGALLSGAQSAYDLALRNYTYQQELHAQGLASEADLQSAEGNLRGAEANLASVRAEVSDEGRAYFEEQIRSTRAQLEATERGGDTIGESAGTQQQQLQIQIDSLGDKLEKGPVEAPVDGVVGRLLVEEGQYVMEQTPVALIYGDGTLYLEAELLEEDAIALRLGETVSCKLADNTPFEATISFISPVVTEIPSSLGLLESRRKVELHPVDPPAALCAGSQVDLTFASVVAEQALIVPTGALVPHEGGSAVYVLQNGKIRLVPVVVGRRASGYVDIAEGLGEGDRVLTDPYRDGVKAGARARVSG